MQVHSCCNLLQLCVSGTLVRGNAFGWTDNCGTPLSEGKAEICIPGLKLKRAEHLSWVGDDGDSRVKRVALHTRAATFWYFLALRLCGYITHSSPPKCACFLCFCGWNLFSSQGQRDLVVTVDKCHSNALFGFFCLFWQGLELIIICIINYSVNYFAV